MKRIDRKISLWRALAWKVAGVDSDIMVNCPKVEQDSGTALGTIAAMTACYQTMVFGAIGAKVFPTGGHLSAEVIATAIFAALFILTLDSEVVMRSGWYASGEELLKKAGLDITGGWPAKLKGKFYLAVRLLLAIGLSQLAAIFLTLIVFSHDINARINDDYLNRNAAVIATATADVDGQIKIATNSATAEQQRVVALSSQITAERQNLIDPTTGNGAMKDAEAEVARLIAEQTAAQNDLAAAQNYVADEMGGIKDAQAGSSGVAGRGPRYRAGVQKVALAQSRLEQINTALASARARLQTLRSNAGASAAGIEADAKANLPALEASLASEQGRMATLQTRLSALRGGRDEAIRVEVQNAPGYVPPNDGLIVQLQALESIADDPRVKAFIILVDLVSFGFETAGVVAKVFNHMPTTYAARVASDVYMSAVRIVDGIEAEFRRRWPDDPEGAAAEPPTGPTILGGGEAATEDVDEEAEPVISAGGIGVLNGTYQAPPRRPRGRPRKHPLN